ncbi:GNAT family N-acetyltransferase [Paenibacillus herberti]|uniref:N-acetyltransferase domain-containing protein n=1 Tax=Paenibacillus herberti TaxID=1619309 RepID=A0A229NU65_9BACL|nr:GNAT family N-acetyltransferase [Paenibacillus herberti]OXM13410.1 hypothetical protein CGZ75_20350 [Paenibacillus herberti]
MHSLNLLPTDWETKRFRIRRIQAAEAGQVQDFYEKVMPSTGWNEGTFNPTYISDAMAGKPELPPNGEVGRVLMQLAERKESGEEQDIAALIEMYHGYPGEQDLYIGLFGIDPNYRGLGYGKEIVAGIVQAASELGFEKVRVAVDLKNWPGLRFWIGCGFTEAVKVKGEWEHGEEAIAVIELAMSIEKG